MKSPVTIVVIVLSCQTTLADAQAQACLGANLETPFPGAIEVTTGRADVPSAQFPGIWQEGLIDGWPYKVFGNSDVVIQSHASRPEWRLSFACVNNSSECRDEVLGEPPAEAFNTLADLKACLQGKAKNVSDSAKTDIQEKQSSVADVTCGSATILDQNEEVVLQTLLTLAGADPGVVDGVLGPKTFQALSDTLGINGAQLETKDAIVMLDNLLCN